MTGERERSLQFVKTCSELKIQRCLDSALSVLRDEVCMVEIETKNSTFPSYDCGMERECMAERIVNVFLINVTCEYVLTKKVSIHYSTYLHLLCT